MRATFGGGEEAEGDPDERDAPQVVGELSQGVRSTGACRVNALQQAVLVQGVASEILQSAHGHSYEPRGEELHALEEEDVIDELVLVWWPWKDDHQEDHRKHCHANAVNWYQRCYVDEQVDWVLQFTENIPVMRQVMVHEKCTESQPNIANHAPRGPCSVGVSLLLQYGEMKIPLELMLDISPHAVQGSFRSRAYARPHVWIRQHATLDDVPEARQQPSAHGRGDLEQVSLCLLSVQCNPL
mmetsp:Transcript_51060/g.163413  ORF Transcript_51060/g.163413 Transcript_51060/m.163413 type:complete len:241 (+) Transcript_51060:2101-2823(+)